MQRVDLLLEEAQSETENTESTSDSGVPESEYIRAFNDAQVKIHSAILLQNPKILKKEKLITAVALQEAYDLPADVFGTTRIEKVEYSVTGNEQDFYEIDNGETEERQPGSSGNPSYYLRQNNQILSQPAPQQAGVFRVTYEKVLPALDKRRGRVESVVLDSGASQITSLVIDATTFTSDDVQVVNRKEYLCVVSKAGVIKMKGIPITEINANTGEVTVETFTYEAGETIAVGDYIVAGEYATTHSQLPDICERYLLKFAVWRILKRDSSNDSKEAKQELDEMMGDILATYGRPDKEVHGIPIIDSEYF